MTISIGEAPIWDDDQPGPSTVAGAAPDNTDPRRSDSVAAAPPPDLGDVPERVSVADPPVSATPEQPRTAASAVLDQVDVQDILGREILAAHLAGLISQIVQAQAAGTAVVHIDGRWGAGKSTLVDLLLRRLDQPREGSAIAHLHEPLVIRYDAWRESSIAPEWWSIATTINRAVREERALVARCAMTAVGLLQRIVRSPSVLVAGALLGLAVTSLAAGAWKNAEALGKLVTTLTAVATLGLIAGRVLFWTSPTFGRLQTGTDDNPLGHVAAVVGSFRRWSPRRTGAQRIADTGLAVWLAFAAGYAAIALLGSGVDHTVSATALAWIQARPIPLAVAAVTVLLVLGVSVRVNPTGRSRPAAWSQPGPVSGTLTRWFLRSGVRAAAALMAATGIAVALSTPAPAWLSAWTQRHPEASIAGVALLGVLLHAWWTRSIVATTRRPMVLIIDDLDRCPADRVVKLLETVHTLLREPSALRWLVAWRTSAPLVVLVLADARWIRAAFEDVYKPFVDLGSDLHTLGADFVQKVFDHAVLVPALSASQVRDYVATVTGGDAATAGDNPDARVRSEVAKQKVLEVVQEANPGDLRTREAETLMRNPALLPEDQIELEMARAEREASPKALTIRARHLLTGYA